jgi:hypothetical protein
MYLRIRAQRNFYIAGFALFLCLVIKRMVGLISANATLQVIQMFPVNQPFFAVSFFRVSDPDPFTGSVSGSGSAWIRINLSCWIRIRIQIADPDPGGQK